MTVPSATRGFIDCYWVMILPGYSTIDPETVLCLHNCHIVDDELFPALIVLDLQEFPLEEGTTWADILNHPVVYRRKFKKLHRSTGEMQKTFFSCEIVIFLYRAVQ